MSTDFDDLVIGAGMAGLAVAGLLAREGRRVLVLEAHDVPGGYAHTFSVGKYRFCAQVHYIFGCGEGETVNGLLERLGIADQVPFVRLDPEGFDHVVVGGERFRVPNGLAKHRDRLIRRFPEHREPLVRYFHEVAAVAEELDLLPKQITPLVALRSAHRHLRLLRYLKWTLADFYDHVGMPPLLRGVLAGQSGDYLLPPRDVSFLLHVALVSGYDKGAFYPRDHFFHFVESIAEVIRSSPGCRLLLEHEVARIHVERGNVTGVTTAGGQTFTARRYVSNVDPQLTARLAGERWFEKDTRRLDYEYSYGTLTLYLAVRGIDLREHGFGSFNVWHYPHADIDRLYDDQLLRHDLSNPWLFLSTPTLHSGAPGLCPPDEQILEVATVMDHDRFARLRREDRRAYNREKKAIVAGVLDIIESRYVPELRRHLSVRVAGTPATNARFCRAPLGNSYGAALVPANMRPGRGPYRSAVENLWLANATAGFPSVAGAIGAGVRLYEDLAAR
ncbi:MAG: NAD(P)/FAD-dependent oxidoreductase [Myxococcales bacterium]|nr:NAD(P)/FAD-dependent oxidoreductase [Myxococcales bacterium]